VAAKIADYTRSVTPTNDAAATIKHTPTDVGRTTFENEGRTLTAVSLASAFNGVVDKHGSTVPDQQI
jgi:hypothetical protein